MPGITDYPLAAFGLLWPAIVAEQASALAAAVAQGFIDLTGDHEADELEQPAWLTPNEIVLELASVRLRRFRKAAKAPPILVCAPFALHGATLTDLAPGHSLVEALKATTRGAVFVTDWRSAKAEMSSRTIDNYLADLNVLIDAIGPPVDLIGLCQGGWMGLVYAARFPKKVRKLVLAGAPINVAAGDSLLSRRAQSTPMAVFRELVALGGGRMLGRRLFRLWGENGLETEAIRSILQSAHAIDSDSFYRLEARFRAWYAWTLDLPGRYYLEVVERLYLKNELATGGFTALGQPVDLVALRLPIYLLAARDDHVVAPAQTLDLARLIGPHGDVRHALAPCDHLGLFMGRQILANEWREIGHWLTQSASTLFDAA
jgi:poly(3-hydroxybutyrate) depolymerase